MSQEWEAQLGLCRLLGITRGLPGPSVEPVGLDWRPVAKAAWATLAEDKSIPQATWQ